jgi:hypothetical protein
MLCCATEFFSLIEIIDQSLLYTYFLSGQSYFVSNGDMAYMSMLTLYIYISVVRIKDVSLFQFHILQFCFNFWIHNFNF